MPDPFEILNKLPGGSLTTPALPPVQTSPFATLNTKMDTVNTLIQRSPDPTKFIEDNKDLVKNEAVAKSFPSNKSFLDRLLEGGNILKGDYYRAKEVAGELGFGDKKQAAIEAEKAFKKTSSTSLIEDVDSVSSLLMWAKQNGAQQLPQMAATFGAAGIGTAIGAGIGLLTPLPGGMLLGAALGNRLGSFMVSFILNLGNTQEALRGVSKTVESPGLILASGAINAALDTILPARIGSMLVGTLGRKGANKFLQLTVKNIIKQTAIEGAKSASIGGIVNATQAAVNEVAVSSATNKRIDEKKLVSSVVNAFAVGAFMGGAIGTVTKPASILLHAKTTKATLDALNALSEQSPLKEQDNNSFAGITGQNIRDGGVNRFIVNTDMLLWWANQHPDPKILEKLGVTNQLNNKDVFLSPETFSAYVLGTKQYDQLIRFVTTPDGQSMESVGKLFSNLETIQSMKTKVGDFPISDKLKETVLKTLDRFYTNDPVAVLDQAPPEVGVVLAGLLEEVGKRKIDITEQLKTGRVNILDSQLNTKNREVLALEKELSSKPKNKNLIKKLDKTLSEVSKLEGERSNLLFPQKQPALLPEFQQVDKLLRKKNIQVKGKILQDLAVKSTTRALQAVRKGFQTGLKNAKTLIQKKKEIGKQIKALPLTDKQKIIQTNRIVNTETSAQFERTLQLVQARLDVLLQKTHRREIINALKKVVRKTKRKGKEGKFSPEVQNYLDGIREILSMPRKTLAERKNIQDTLNRRLDTPFPNPDDAYKNLLYSLLLDLPATNLFEAENLLVDIASAKEQGKLAALVRKNTRQWKISSDVEEATNAVLAGKNPEQIDTSSLVARLVGRITQTGNIKDALISTWSDILDIAFNKKGVDGSFIKNLDFSREISAWKQMNIKEEGKFLDIYRTIYGLKDNNQALNRMQEDSKVEDLGLFQDLNGREVRLQYSKAEIRKIWMERQDPSLHDVFSLKEGNAFTEQMFKALWSRMDGKDVAFATEQLTIYRNFYNEINKVYRRMYGVDLPFNEWYSPVIRDKGKLSEADTTTFGGEEILVNELKLRRSIPKQLLQRKLNEVALGKQNDITTMYQHIHNMSWYINTAEKALHIKNVFKDEQLKKAITLQHGEGMMANINNFIEDFTVGSIKRGNEFNKFISGMNKRFSESVLVLKPTIGIKQLTSWFAMADNIPSKDFMVYQKEFFTSPKKIMKFLYESTPSLQTRGNSLEFELARLGAVEKQVFNIKNKKKWQDLAFSLIKGGDRLPIYGGGWAIYQHAVKTGKTHSQAIALFEQALNDTQQSTDMDKLSAVQRDYAIGRTLTMFMTARLALLRGEMRAWRQSPLPIIGRDKIGWKEFGKRIGYYHFVMPMLVQYIASGFKWENKDQLTAAIAGQLNGFIIFGELLMATLSDIFAEKGDRKRELDTSLPLISILNEIRKGVYEVANSDWESEKILAGLGDLGSAIGKLTGKPIEQLMNIFGGIGNIEDKEIKKGLKRISGLSEKVASK